MGMDVFGGKPDSPLGQYFRSNIWRWSALWGYCVSVSPEAASLGNDAYFNEGDGLNAEDSKKLAAILRQELSSGKTKDAVRKIEQFEVAPHTPPAAQTLFKFANAENCEVPPPRFTEQDVRDFADFLEHCGGFSIW